MEAMTQGGTWQRKVSHWTVVQITEFVKEFDAAHEDNPTICYWWKYMQLVSILPRFRRTLREGDCGISHCSQKCFNDLQHLTMWITLDWVSFSFADMNLVPKTPPEMYHGLQRGGFVTKETHHAFNQIPDDQVLEHVNKSGKLVGGLVRITRTD